MSKGALIQGHSSTNEGDAGVVLDEGSPGRSSSGGFVAMGEHLRRYGARVAKSLAALVVGTIGLWAAFRPLVLSVSTEASVGATVVTLRAPIDGMLDSASLKVGRIVDDRAPLGKINNPRVDALFVEQLEQRLRTADAEIAALSPFISELETMGRGLDSSTRAYQTHRQSQLRAVLAQAEARLEADRAQAREASERFQRNDDLASVGIVAAEQRASSKRDSEMAAQGVTASSRALDAVKTEIEAAGHGITVDANGLGADRPYTHQRLDQVRLDLAQWRERLDEQTKLRDTLRSSVEQAKDRLKQLREADVSVPSRSRIWSVLAASNGFVSKGAPIAALLDCRSIVVVAVVSGRVFDRLTIGSPARFTMRESGAILTGHVIHLTGGEGGGEEDGLVAPGLKSETGQRRVVVSFDDSPNALEEACAVGQSGEVRFR